MTCVLNKDQDKPGHQDSQGNALNEQLRVAEFLMWTVKTRVATVREKVREILKRILSGNPWKTDQFRRFPG